MSNQAVDRYIELKQQIAALEKELDELKEDVFQSVDGQGGEIAGEGFTLRSYKTPRYKFSAEYESKNDELKTLRKSEIESGAATVDGYSEFVKINFKKPKATD